MLSILGDLLLERLVRILPASVRRTILGSLHLGHLGVVRGLFVSLDRIFQNDRQRFYSSGIRSLNEAIPVSFC